MGMRAQLLGIMTQLTGMRAKLMWVRANVMGMRTKLLGMRAKLMGLEDKEILQMLTPAFGGGRAQRQWNQTATEAMLSQCDAVSNRSGWRRTTTKLFLRGRPRTSSAAR